MTTICLVRHGETDWNAIGRLQGREDTELNANGVTQAEACAEYLAQSHWDGIVSSTLKRARATAQIIADRIGVGPVIEDGDLVERDYGKASGLLLEERQARFPDGKYPEIEDYELLQTRAMRAMDAAAKRFQGKRVIVVSHGSLINSIINKVTNGEHGTGKTRLVNASVNFIRFDGSRWELELFNHNVTGAI